jgi:hypothetical protein
VIVSIIADGNVRSVLTNGSSGANTPTAGAIGLSFGEWNSNLTVLINVLGLVDTLRNNFGTALLPPTNSGLTKGQLSALIDYRRLLWGQFGVHGYVSGAPNFFLDSNSSGVKTVQAFNVALGAQFSMEVFNQDVQGTSLSVLLDAGPTLRAIGGDLASSANDTLRRRLLTTSGLVFGGAELGLTVALKEVRLGVSTYFFGGNVPGLSHGQAVFGFAVANAFFAGRATIADPPTDAARKARAAAAAARPAQAAADAAAATAAAAAAEAVRAKQVAPPQ